MSQITDIQTILGTTPDGIFAARSQAALACATTNQKVQIQRVLGVKMDGDFGPASMSALTALIHTPAKANGWAFSLVIDGDDFLVNNIICTCFGGGFDPQDNGATASGVSTLGDNVCGVSLPMRGQDFPHLSLAEHRALDDSPIPKMPWGTPVEVTINGKTFTPPAGVIDLGPGHQATTNPNDPHVCDLTPPAAQHFAPSMSLKLISRNFEERGSIRVIGGRKFLP